MELPRPTQLAVMAKDVERLQKITEELSRNQTDLGANMRVLTRLVDDHLTRPIGGVLPLPVPSQR